MAFDQSLIRRIESLSLAIGNEKNLREIVEEYAVPMGFTVSQDVLGNTVARRARDEGRAVALFTPVSSRSFAVRYLDENKLAYLHTEVENWETWVGRDIVFPNGTTASLEKTDTGKITAKLPDTNGIMQGTSAQLKKACRFSADGKTLYGTDLTNVINIYTLLQLISQLPRDVSLEICFASQHKAAAYHPGGKLLAARNMSAGTRLWIEAAEDAAAGLFAETGDSGYLLSNSMLNRLEGMSIRPRKRVCAFKGAVAELIREAGPETLGVGIPVRTESGEEAVSYRDVEELTSFLLEFAGGTYARD